MNWESIWRAIKRLGRVTSAVVIAGWIAALTDNEAFLALAPIIASVFKFMRENYPQTWGWLPL